MKNYIARGFAGEGETSLVRKRNLQALMVVEKLTSFRLITLNLVILFSDSDFKGID